MVPPYMEDKMPDIQVCPACGGSGTVGSDICETCYGTGSLPLRGVNFIISKTLEKVNDVLDKCNDIKEKVDEIKEKVDTL